MRRNAKVPIRKSTKPDDPRADHVQGLGPPIREFCYPQRERTLAGIVISHREASIYFARIALWDGDYGFLVYPFSQENLFGAANAATAIERVVERVCKQPHTLFLGELAIDGGTKALRFEGSESTERILALKNLLTRAFGFKGLQERAADILKKNPAVYLDSQSLGLLQQVVLGGSWIERN